MSKPLPDHVSSMPNVIFQQINAEAVLLDLNTEQYFALNELGARLWQLISDGTDVQAVVGRLLEDYEIDEETLRNDIADWISELSGLGLVRIDVDLP
jgi:hypothetical protein